MAILIKIISNRVERLNESAYAYLMLSPALLIVGVMALWPMLWTFEMSLHADTRLSAGLVGDLIGFQNYVDLLTGQMSIFLPQPFLDFNTPFQSAVSVTLIFTLASVALETVLGLTQALILDKSFKGRSIFRTIVLIPWAVPVVIQGMMFYLLFTSPIGIGGDIFHAIGIFPSNAPLTRSSSTTIVAILADTWKRSAFMTLIILAGLQSVDRNLYDVARIEGASRWERFRTITYPIILPAIIVALIFRTIGATRIYGLVVSLSSCNTVPTFSCLAVQTFRNQRYATSATINVVMAIIIAILVFMYLIKYRDVQQAQGGF